LPEQCTTLKPEPWTSSHEVTIVAVPLAQHAALQPRQCQISVHLQEQSVLALWNRGYSPHQAIVTLRTVLGFAVAVLSCYLLVIPAMAQQEQPQQDPENERRLGLWLDQTISAGLSSNRSLEFESHERLDEGASNLFEYFFQAGIGFRLRPWLMVIPIYRYQRYPGDPFTSYENRLLLNVTLSHPLGRWRPNLRTLTEGRFPENRIASARIRLRPGIEYTLPLHMKRPPVVVVNNEFFIVIGANSFASGSNFTQNRFQAGVRLPISDSVSIRPYYMLQSVHPPTGWDGNGVIGISLAFRLENPFRSLRP
jgi:hypothetical protein